MRTHWFVVNTKMSVGWKAVRNATLVWLLLSCWLGTARAQVYGDYTCAQNNTTVVITKYVGSGGVVSIPDTINGKPVVGILDDAFSYSRNLASITIPNTVTRIGNRAFAECSSLTNVTLPSSLNVVEASAFASCIRLTGVRIPASVSQIGNAAFFECNRLLWAEFEGDAPGTFGQQVFAYTAPGFTVFYHAGKSGFMSPKWFGYDARILLAGGWFQYATNSYGLTLTQYTGPGGSVSIPATIDGKLVTAIGPYAFAECRTVSEVIIPDGVTFIERDTFLECMGLTHVTVGNGVTNIGEYAFSLPNLTSIVMGQNVQTIGDRAFFGCMRLNGIVIPDSVTSIGVDAFRYCTNLSRIDIPAGVRNIGVGAFSSCSRLGEIAVDPANPVYSSVNGALVNKSGTLFIQCPGAASGSYALPDGVTTIGERAFADCRSLTSVAVGDSVVAIGRSAFSYCINLATVSLGSRLTSIESSAFYATGLTNVSIPQSVQSIRQWAFSECSNLTDVVMVPGITSISDGAFSGCFRLAGVNLPTSVTSIGDEVFASCRGLTNVVIPAKVASIGFRAFAFCSRLSSAVFEGDAPAAFGSRVFEGAATGFTIYYPGGASGFTSPTWKGYRCLMQPEPESNLQWIENISTVTIMTYLGSNGTVVLPDSIHGKPVVAIGGGVLFQRRSSVTNIYIPEGVKSVSSEAFYLCTNLASVTLPSSVIRIGYLAFAGCERLTSINIPEGVTNIGDNAFSTCGLTNVVIPKGVIAIGENAFSECNHLEKVQFQGDAPACGNNVFIAAAPGFTVYYRADANGFSSPSWRGYPALMMPVLEARAAGKVRILGEPGKAMQVEYTDQLGANATWNVLTNISLSANAAEFTDAAAGVGSGRFYRVISK